jgi:hypothetical protein
MVDIIIFLQSQKKGPVAFHTTVIHGGLYGQSSFKYLMISILVPKRTKYFNPLIFKDLLRNRNFRRE